MKRTLVFIIASLICVSMKAQDFPKNINGELEFVEVIETKLSKTMLYSNAKEWIAKTFGDYKRVIQFEDNENGKLIIKGISNVNYIGNSSLTETKEQISYTLTIETKEGKYRYKLDNILINQSVNVMGSIVYPKPFIPLEHLNLIEKYSHVLDSLKKEDITKMKKKVLTDHQENISINENYLENESNFYKQEYLAIIDLIDSLKKSMLINNDF